MSWRDGDERWAEFARSHEEFIDELTRLYKDDSNGDDFCKTVQTYPICKKDVEELYDKLTYIYMALDKYANEAWVYFIRQMREALRPFIEYTQKVTEDLDDFKETCFGVEKDFALEQELRERRFAKPVEYNYIPVISRNMPYMRRRF